MKTDMPTHVHPISAEHRDLDRARPAAFVTTAAVFVVVMLGTSLPSPLFALYQKVLGISALTVTVLYTIYAVGVILALLVANSLTVRLGRRRTMITGLVLSGLAAATFLLTTNVAVLVAARVLSGLAAGLVTGSATAALIDYGGEARRARSAMVAVGVNMGGLALGTLLTGAVADVGVEPLRLPFLVDLFLLCLVGAFVWLVPASGGTATGAGDPRTGQPRIRGSFGALAPVRRVFLEAAVSGGLGFAANGLVTTIAAVFMARYLGITSHLPAGGVTALVFLATAAGQLLARRLSGRRAVSFGCAGLIAGLGLLTVSLQSPHLSLFTAAALVLGTSTGTCIGAGLSRLADAALPEHRTVTASAYFVTLYAFLAVPVIGAGLLQNLMPLPTAVTIFCATGVIALIAVLVTTLKHRLRAPTHPRR